MAVDRYVKLPVYDESGNLTREEIHIDPRALTRFFRDAARKHILPDPAEEERWRDVPFEGPWSQPSCDYEISRHGTVRTKTGKIVIHPTKVVWSDDPQVEIQVDLNRTLYINPKIMVKRVWGGIALDKTLALGIHERSQNTYLRDFKIAQSAIVGEMHTDEYHRAITSEVKARILLERLIDEGWQAPKHD